MHPPAPTRQMTAGPNERLSPSPAADFEAFLGEHVQFVARVVRRVIRGPEVDDLVQDVFVTALVRWETERIDNPRAWLATIAFRKALDYLKRQKRRREVAFDDDSGFADPAGPDAQAERDRQRENAEERALVLGAIKHLPRKDQKLLFKILNSSAAEVARVSQTTSAAVRGKYKRAIARLRKMLTLSNRRKS